MAATDPAPYSPYRSFTRAEWSRLRNGASLQLSQEELLSLRSLNDHLALDAVADIFLPLTRLLQIYIASARHLYQATSGLLGAPVGRVPYVIGVAGSVAVGKSTTARLLQALLARSAGAPNVELVTTDGFLHPNRVLEARGIMHRKGFPESYDRRRLLQFMIDLKSGRPGLTVPVYSHLSYDILPDEARLVERPDVVIVEGLNVLQRGGGRSGRAPTVFVSDFFDFSIYVDATEDRLERWYVERFLKLRETAFRDDASYFRRYGALSEAAASEMAHRIWREINLVNLRTNIAPTRDRADMILEKGERHTLEKVYLRKI